MPLRLDNPPDKYDPQALQKIFRKIELWAIQIENNGPLVVSGLNVSQLETTGYDLPVGQVYSGDVGPVGWGGVCATTGVLRVVQDGEGYFQGSSAGASVGQVTVSIT